MMRTRVLLFHVVLVYSISFTEPRIWGVLGMFSLSSCKNTDHPIDCHLVRQNAKRIRTYYNQSNSIFCGTDISSNYVLTERILNILDDQQSTFRRLCGNHLTATEDISIIIFGLMTFEMTQLTSALLLTSAIPFISVTFQPIYPAGFLHHPYFVYSYECDHQRFIKKIMLALHEKSSVYQVGILNIHNGQDLVDYGATEESSCFNNTKRPFCVNYKENSYDFSLKETGVDVDNRTAVRTVTQRLLKESRMKFIVLFGEKSNINKFYNQAFLHFKGILNNFYFLDAPSADVRVTSANDMKSISTFQDIIVNSPGDHVINQLIYCITNYKLYFTDERNIMTITSSNNAQTKLKRIITENLYFIKFFYPTFKNNDTLTPKVWRQLPHYIQDWFFQKIAYSNDVVEGFLGYFKRRYYNNLTSIFHANDSSLIPKAKEAHGKLSCKIGTESRRQFHKGTFWKNSLEWKCMPCMDGYFKDTNGTVKCQKCPKYFKSNQDHCYDPYKAIFIELTDVNIKVYICLSTVLIISIFATIIMKCLNNSIIPKSSKRMLVAEMSVLLMLTVSLGFLFVGLPNKVVCTLRMIIIGSMLTATVSITTSKIFKETKISQYFLIFLLTAVNLLFSILVTQVTAPNKQVVYIERHLQKEVSCNNNQHVFLQLVFIVLLQLVNVVQGFKTRHQFKSRDFQQTQHLMYSAIASLALLAIATVAFFILRTQYAETMVILFTTFAMVSLQFASLYTFKLLLILRKLSINCKIFRTEKYSFH